MLQLAKTIPYDKAVAEGKVIVSSVYERQWRLGEIANLIEPKYGDSTLAKFAEEIDINYGTLKKCRSVARAWPQMGGRPPISFSVANALVTHPNREQIARDNPLLTEAQARALVKEYFAEPEDGDEEVTVTDESLDSLDDPENEPIGHDLDGCGTSYNEDEETLWRNNLASMAVYSTGLLSHWEKRFSNWRDIKATIKDVELANDAAKSWAHIATILKGNM